MIARLRSYRFIVPLVVLAGSVLVHVPFIGLTGASSAFADRKARPGVVPPADAPATSAFALPHAVAEIRDAMLAAAESGDIEELRTVLDWNEMKPEVAAAPVGDIIAYWRSLSANADGAEVLAALRAILLAGPAVVRGGRDVENDRLYVWPGLAERPVASLDADDLAALGRIATEGEIAQMKANGRYIGWRLVIGADGVWHSLRRHE